MTRGRCPFRSHDLDCRDFASPGMPLPPDVRASCAPEALVQPPPVADRAGTPRDDAGSVSACGETCVRPAAGAGAGTAAPSAAEEADAARRAEEEAEDQAILAALLEMEARYGLTGTVGTALVGA